MLDPRLEHVLVRRVSCKACGHVRREYPVGVGRGRLSLATLQTCRLLHAIGLSYATMRAVLRGLGLAVSVGTLHRAASGLAEPAGGRLRLAPRPEDPARLHGPDGSIAFQWSGWRPATCHLVVEVGGGPEADALRWRLERAIQRSWLVHTES